MFPLIDRLSLQPSLRPLGVLVFFLFLTHICKASDAISCPVISLLGIDTMGVNLNCDSKGWKAEPEVFWLDAEGNRLPAERTDTVRGPDDLYNVSSRVTVEKRHSNSFTCRVKQNHTNQIREAQIYIADDFFDVQSISSTTVGLVVGLVLCLLMNLILGFFVWKFKTKKSHRDQTNEGEKKNRSKRYRIEDHCVTEEETESQQLMTPETVQMKDLKKGKAARIKPEEELSREAAEKAQKALEEELEAAKTEHEKKQADLQQLHEEKQRKEKNLQRLKERLEKKNTEVETLGVELTKHSWFSSGSKKEKEQKKKEAEKEVENLKKQLETEKMELATKIKEFDDKQAEVQKLGDGIQTMENNLKTEKEKLESYNVKFERSGAAPVQSSSS
ncbi:uncharacterized protein [Pagrus major]|uniref:uncharacterized protein n=1 Tax=Pagrus major TaxID=143350 RepID=UPI003CC85236